MNWNLTLPFCHYRSEAVWSNLGDVGKSSGMASVVDAQGVNDSRDEDEGSVGEDNSFNNEDANDADQEC